MGRDRRRWWTQWAGLRGLPGPGRDEAARPRATRGRRRRRRHGGALAGLQGELPELRPEPDAAADHQRARAAQAGLQGLPDGTLLHGLPGRLRGRHVRRSGSSPRRDGALLEARRGPLPRVLGLEGRPRQGHPAPALDDPAEARQPVIARPARPAPLRLEAPRPRRPGRRRPDPDHDDERGRPARRLVRVGPDQGGPVGRRDHRHVGRSVRAGDGLRPPPSRDRHDRRGRGGGRDRSLGLRRGRHGRAQPEPRRGGRGVRRHGPHERPGRADRGRGRDGPSGSSWRTGRSSGRRSSSRTPTPRSPSSGSSTRTPCRPSSSRTCGTSTPALEP